MRFSAFDVAPMTVLGGRQSCGLVNAFAKSLLGPAQSPPAPSAPRSPAAEVVKPRHPPPSRARGRTPHRRARHDHVASGVGGDGGRRRGGPQLPTSRPNSDWGGSQSRLGNGRLPGSPARIQPRIGRNGRIPSLEFWRREESSGAILNSISTTPCMQAQPRWCSTSSAAVLLIFKLGFWKPDAS